MNPRKILFWLFFVSGFCGLLYQVIWVRLAFAHFGVITPVLSVIVSVFMLGLSLGSWMAGRWVQKLTAYFNVSAAYFYAGTEFLIGLSSVTVPWLFQRGDAWLLSGGEANSISYLVSSAFIMAAAVLPWCICMGATFPFMMAFIREKDPSATSGFSFLYLANVIGAILGTILTADVLVEVMGFHWTLLLAGALNMAIALMSISLAHASPVSSNHDAPSDEATLRAAIPTEKSSTSPGWLGLILFTTGFTSMSAEVIWTRAFTPILNTTIYAFALVLAIYLAGTATGSYFYRRHLRLGNVITNPVLLTILALCSFMPIILNDPRLDLRTFGVEISIFPLCAVLGYLTPKIIDQYSLGDPHQAGRAYAINVIGCVLGPLVASYFLLPMSGVKMSLVWLSLPFILLFIRESGWLGAPARIGAIASLTLLLVGSQWKALSYEEKYPSGIVRRDHTATVISAGQGMDKHLYVNGQGITTLSTITKSLAHMPLAFFQGTPKTALTICFGMGTTFRSLLTWDIRTTAVELVPSVKQAFGYYHPDAEKVLGNPLGHVVIDDGRRFLKRTPESFDVITIDPPPPVEAAGSSLLYSTEFYDLLKTRLTSHGILQQWFPGGEGPEAEAIGRSLSLSFPYIRVYRSLAGEGLLFLASMQPLDVPSAEELVMRLPQKAKQDLLEWEKEDIHTIAKRMLSQELPLTHIMGDNPSHVITDNQPFNEYYLLRRSWKRLNVTLHS